MGCCQASKVAAIDEQPSYSRTNMDWLNPQYQDKEHTVILKPDELESLLRYPPEYTDKLVENRLKGSMVGLALGDALGAHVEFRPRQYLVDHPVTDLEGGGTWGLREGQFTDDTSMALCLAISLIANCGFNSYDQLLRYKWWYKNGYMSSTGECFDIGKATRSSIEEFERRQHKFIEKYQISEKELDHITDETILKKFNSYCGDPEGAGNGGLMRLAPVPLFFFRNPKEAVEYSGLSALTTHGDEKTRDACRFYGALIVAAIRGESKADLLDKNFYKKHRDWFGDTPLHADILEIAKGSYKKQNGYDDGIRGKGYVLDSMRAALWAFWSDEGSFEKGVLAAINLGDDTDTTAAIYGQLAGAYYGYRALPEKWTKRIYASKFITCLSMWIAFQGQRHSEKQELIAKKAILLSKL